MRQVLSCECGFELVSTDVVELVETARRHAQRAHGMDLSIAQVAALVRPVEGAGDGRSGTRTEAERRQGWTSEE